MSETERIYAMKKILTFAIALALLLSMTACGGSKTVEIRLGTSAFSIAIPDGYEKAEDDFSTDQIAYYYRDDDSIDFDVYQWAKGEYYTLESEAEHFASEYGTTAEAVTVNGIKCMKYVSVEEYEGGTYTVVNYMLEDDVYLVEVSFWTVDTDEEYATVDKIINTLKKN